eukprot:GSA25T00008091001.1
MVFDASVDTTREESRRLRSSPLVVDDRPWQEDGELLQKGGRGNSLEEQYGQQRSDTGRHTPGSKRSSGSGSRRRSSPPPQPPPAVVMQAAEEEAQIPTVSRRPSYMERSMEAYLEREERRSEQERRSEERTRSRSHSRREGEHAHVDVLRGNPSGG